MAIYRQGQASMDAQGYVTGYDTKWREQLTLIRPGATIFFLSEQLQAAVITEVINDTSIRAISTGGVEVPRTNYIILLHDSLTVDGLAQDVAETLRYYQGKEAVIEEAIEFFKTFNDWDRINEIMQQFKEYSDTAKNSAQSAEQSKNEATLQAQNSAQSASQANTAKDQANAANQAAQQAKNKANQANESAQGAKVDAANSAEEAKRYLDQAQTIVADGVGLANKPRDCPDISGNPSAYLGFIRIRENVPGWPSIASGEAYLSGYIQCNDGSPSYVGLFQGWVSRSLYTYRWAANIGPQWTRHARKDEIGDYDGFRDSIGLGRNNVRDFLTLGLRSTYSQPLSISSQNPTIRFTETDRPSGSPLYEFVFDGGNWRIQKGGEGFKGEYVISYRYREDDVTIPKLSVGELSVNDIFVPTQRLQGVKDSLLIPNTGLARWIDYNAPAGAEKGKYYPVIISQPPGWNGDAFIEVSMRTRSLSGSQKPNCNMIHLWIRDAGWSDMGQGAFGHYHCYDAREVAISCVRGTDKGQYPHNAIYVLGDAFPIRLSTTVGCTITIPTRDWRPSTASDSPIYKWGIVAANDGVGGDFGCSNLLDFSKGRTGFYSNNQFVDGGGNKYLRDGLGDGGTITLGIENLVNNGRITAQKGITIIENSDWDMLAVSSDMTMKPVSGSSGAPSSGTAVGFSISHNIDSSAQLSFYNNGAYFRTGDPTNQGDWTKLSSEKFVTDKLRSYMTQSDLSNALESGNYGGNFYHLTGNEAFYLRRLGTTTAGANMYLDPNPAVSHVLRSTSSSRYKRSIETLVDDYADLMLNMRPVWYQSTCENDREDWGWYGLIAEEVGEIAPEYVHWRPLQEGEDPAIASSNGMVAEGVMYERLTVPLIHHVKNLKTENEEMRKEIADLKNGNEEMRKEIADLKNSIDELKAVMEALINKPATLN